MDRAFRLTATETHAVTARELLVALAGLEPAIVSSTAAALGIDGRRLAWVLSEWWDNATPITPIRTTHELGRPVADIVQQARAAGEPFARAMATLLLRTPPGQPTASSNPIHGLVRALRLA